MKKLLSLLLAAALLLSLLPTALAAECTHKWRDVDYRTPPTCTEGGTLFQRCDLCHDSRLIPIGPLGHNWKDTSKQATCTENGAQGRACRRCGLKEEKTLPALGHNWGDPEEVTDPTCLERGHYNVKCRRCGFIATFRIEALGHDWGPWYVKVQAEPGVPGIKRRDCTRSDAFEEVPYTVDDPEQPEPAPTDPTEPIEPIEPIDPTEPTEPTVPTSAKGIVSIVLTEVSAPAAGSAYNVDVPEKLTFRYEVISTYAEPITILGVQIYAPAALKDNAVGTDFVGTFSCGSDLYWNPEKIRKKSHLPVPGKTRVVVKYETADGKHRTAKSSQLTSYFTYTKEPEPELTVTKTVLKTPACGYFMPGETVEFAVHIKNTGEVELPWVQFEDARLGISSIYNAALAPGDAINLPHEMSLVVGKPASGVKQWTEENIVVVTSVTDDGEPVMGVGRVTYECRTGEIGIRVRKYETSMPCGEAYVEGENIYYVIQVTNEGNQPLTGATLSDYLANINTPVPELAPGATWTYYLRYRVTAADVAAGEVTNTATVTKADYQASDSVTSPTSEGELPEEILLTKAWIGEVPERGYFIAGDQIDYLIYLKNYSKDAIRNVVFGDALDSGFAPGAAEVEAGEELGAFFSYTVTEADVAAGKVTNWAWVSYKGGFVESNAVTVPVGKPDSILGGETWCARTLTGHSSGADTYAQTYCPEHETIHAQAAALPAAEAAAMWREAADDLYIRWIEQVALNDDLYLKARAERTTFLALADTLAETAPGAAAKLLEDKCTDLCYVLNTSVTEPRPDVLSDDVPAVNLAAPEAACLCAADTQGVTTAALCTAHLSIPEKAAALLQGYPEAGDSMRSAAYTAETRSYENAANRLNAPAAQALAAYVDAAGDNLAVFYGSGTLLVSELTARAAREGLLAICAGK